MNNSMYQIKFHNLAVQCAPTIPVIKLNDVSNFEVINNLKSHSNNKLSINKSINTPQCSKNSILPIPI